MPGFLQEVQILMAGDFKSFKLSLGKIPLLILDNKKGNNVLIVMTLENFGTILKTMGKKTKIHGGK